MRGAQVLPPRYQVVRELGRGGSAVVFLARDEVTQTEVAVKVLRSELNATVVAARFLREIRYLRALEHPHIVPILDAPDEGPLYYVSRYVPGPTLRDRLELEGPLAIDEVVRIVAQMASALDYAHAHNIVHRDLKPENVLFDEDRAMLCDFGIARAIVVSAGDDQLSTSGIVVGTPRYMSPEQVLHAEVIDGRSDVYALGCVAYEMCAGEPPFASAYPQLLFARLLGTDPVPLEQHRSDLPQGFAAVISRAMAKDVAERTPRATALADELTACL